MLRCVTLCVYTGLSVIVCLCLPDLAGEVYVSGAALLLTLLVIVYSAVHEAVLKHMFVFVLRLLFTL